MLCFQVGTNGLITFGEPNDANDGGPEPFPVSYWTYAVAPFWQQFNTTGEGRVLWRIVNDSDSLDMVNTLIKGEYGDTDFDGFWMLVASWENVPVTGDSVSKIEFGHSLCLTIFLCSIECQYLPDCVDLSWYQVICHIHLQVR